MSMMASSSVPERNKGKLVWLLAQAPEVSPGLVPSSVPYTACFSRTGTRSVYRSASTWPAAWQNRTAGEMRLETD